MRTPASVCMPAYQCEQDEALQPCRASPGPFATGEFRACHVYAKDFILWFQFTTEPVYLCHHRTHTNPVAGPEMPPASVGTHHHLPSLNSCRPLSSAGPEPVLCIPHPPGLSLSSQEHQGVGLLMNLPEGGCLRLSATVMSSFTIFPLGLLHSSRLYTHTI